MKHLAVFCDGTWNDRDATEHPTTVARFATLLERDTPEGVVPFYDAGVGVPEADMPSGPQGLWYRLRGGALGDGLTKNIADCYRFLIDAHAPGDRIHIFGFSRGAYTARSLAGLIRNCGLPRDAAHLDAALRWYRSRAPSQAPGTERSHAFRAEISPDVHTSPEEAAWRTANGIDPGVPVDIGYLGIWDTVGAHGIGGVLGQFRYGVPGGHGFHDHDLSRLVKSGRHALALDEDRLVFRPTRWSNLERLNALAEEEGRGPRPYRQEWFPGVHGIVGGGGSERRIANRVAAWIAEGAQEAGLAIDLAADPDFALTDDDHMGDVTVPAGGLDPTRVLRWPRRGPGPGALDALHPVARRRVREDETYRPASLRAALLDESTYAALMREADSRVA